MQCKIWNNNGVGVSGILPMPGTVKELQMLISQLSFQADFVYIVNTPSWNHLQNLPEDWQTRWITHDTKENVLISIPEKLTEPQKESFFNMLLKMNAEMIWLLECRDKATFEELGDYYAIRPSEAIRCIREKKVQAALMLVPDKGTLIYLCDLENEREKLLSINYLNKWKRKKGSLLSTALTIFGIFLLVLFGILTVIGIAISHSQGIL